MNQQPWKDSDLPPDQVLIEEYESGESHWASFEVLTPESAVELEESWWDEFQGQNSSVPPDREWDWRGAAKKSENDVSHEAFAISFNGEVQGACYWELRSPGQNDFGLKESPFTHVRLVAKAPWNRSSLVDSPKYKKVGCSFLRLAVMRSEDIGGEGEVALRCFDIDGLVDYYRDNGFAIRGSPYPDFRQCYLDTTTHHQLFPDVDDSECARTSWWA